MQTDSLENHIATLTKLRDTYHSQLDAIVLGELDEVIEALKRRRDTRDEIRPAGITSGRVLEVIAHVIEIVTNVTNLMK